MMHLLGHIGLHSFLKKSCESSVLNAMKKLTCSCMLLLSFNLFLSLVLSAMKDHNDDPYVVGKAMHAVAFLSATGQLYFSRNRTIIGLGCMYH